MADKLNSSKMRIEQLINEGKTPGVIKSALKCLLFSAKYWIMTHIEVDIFPRCFTVKWNKLSEQVKTELENYLKIDFSKSLYKSRLIGNQNKT